MTAASRSRLVFPGRRSATLFASLVWVAGWVPLSSASAETAAPQNVVSFQTSAATEVTKDTLTITLQALREGADAGAVQAGLKQALDNALTDARRQALPEAMEVRTGAFHVSPRYGREGRITGWQGSAELVLEGRDVGRVAAAAGRLTGLTVTASSFSMSRGLRERMESELVADAIRRFRARAEEMARQFGFAGYALREVQVQGVEVEAARPVLMMRAAARDMAVADAPVPTEAGKGVLTATVQGSVVLTR
jgi:predicted secreted protein